MDYGKLAYLKALDLEGRLGIKKDNFGVWYSDRNGIYSGKTFLAQIDGSGDIAVFVSASKAADFYVDDKLAASGQNVFFLYNGGSIYVESEEYIDKLSIIALGNIKSAVKKGIACADFNSGFVAYVINENGKATAYICYIPSNDVSKVIDENYVQGDACCLDDDFLYALVDPSGRVDMIKAISSKTVSYDLGASSVAVSYCDGKIYVAYIKKGTIYYFILNNFGDKPSPVKLMFNGSADEIRLTKRGSGLSFSSGGKCYFKDLGASSEISDKLYVRFYKEVV